MSGERFILTLRCAHDPYRRTGVHRLRGALRMLLRSFALRCERIEAIPPTPPAGERSEAESVRHDCACGVPSIEADPRAVGNLDATEAIDGERPGWRGRKQRRARDETGTVAKRQSGGYT